MLTWPDYITLAFTQIDPSSVDPASYYGPYNTLLHHLFPASQGYEVAPMPHPGCDASLLFAVKKHNTAVLFVDVHAPSAAVATPASRIHEAVKDMSRALYKVTYKVKGITAFGTKYVVYDYEYDAAANELDATSGAPALVEDVEEGGEERDLRTAKGAERWKAIARSVGAAVPQA